MDGERAAELGRFLVERPINLISQVALDRLAVRGQHAAEHAQLFHGVAQLGDRRIDVLKRDQGHALEPGVFLDGFFIKPVVICLAGKHRPIGRHDSAHGQAGGRVEHRPADAGLFEKLFPIRRGWIAGGAAMLL